MASTALPVAPPSPTLTNPDMILPWNDSPSNGQQDYGSYGDEDWMDGAANMQFSIGSTHTGLGNITPTTPIIYGNGTMLSDIGEVTEAESTVGKGRRLPGPAERRMLKQRQNDPVKSSPTSGSEAPQRRTKVGSHQRHVSIESASTVRSEGHTAHVFADFDDNASVDDSVFLGDDEGSVADSYTEGVIASETQRLSKVHDEDEEGNANSSAALSRRAEEILQNAKQRLNNMEGNLTRARSSLSSYPTNPSVSLHSSSPLTRSTPSPPTKLIPLQLGLPPSKRQLHSPLDTPNNSPGHARGISDHTPGTSQFTSPNLIRSASAAARYGTAKHSPDLSREGGTGGVRTSLISPLGRTTTSRNNGRLEPLNEDEPVVKESRRGSDRSSLEGSSGSSETSPGIARSTSSMQMRDLKDQMYDLKGRLSVLRDRARDDTMKRRSLQSLRTPSPFTAAEQWYTSAKGYGEGRLSADAVVTYAPWQESPISPPSGSPKRLEAEPEYAESDVTSVYEDVSETVGEQNPRPTQRDIPDESQGEEPGIRYDTAVERISEEDDYTDEIISQSEVEDYESDASLYHDSHPVQLSHEDREDAFDYEHFFLHSAMGTISQQRHGRRGSYSSDDSVETTRGPVTSNPVQSKERRLSLGHLRNDSENSISTLASFATATEGYDDEDDEDDNFAVHETRIPSQQQRSASPGVSEKRSTFGSPLDALMNGKHDGNKVGRARSALNMRSSNMSGHIRGASNASNGTTRSFPLDNKPRNNSSNDISPFSSREQIRSSPVDMLQREDQILVEKAVAAVGKCVLGLQEAESTSYEAKVWRRRLDAARRVLEGDEGAV